MRHYFSTFGCVALMLFSASTLAGAVIAKEAIPENVLSSFSKKHPNAINVTAQQKKHFGQDLYLIIFKESKESEGKSISYYRVNGHLYVNGSLVDTGVNSVRLPPASIESLKTDFGTYDIKEAVLIINPNGAGEEYDLTIDASGKTWYVSLDRDGKIVKKEE